MEDLIIYILVVEADRPEHIANHDITIDEVLEVITSDYVVVAGKLARWLLIGKTKKRKFLTIILGERKEKNAYGLVTAYPSPKRDRKFYIEHTQIQKGGEEYERNDKAS